MTAFHPFRHFGLKVLAGGLAILLWLAIAGDPLVERGLRVPLEFQNVPDGIEIVGEMPRTIDIRVRGSAAVLSRLETDDVIAVLDLRSTGAGHRLFHLSPSAVRVPFGVEVAQVTPSTIRLALERLGRRFVPIVPVVEGDPKPGYHVGRVSAQPASVEVVGPISHLADLEHAMTEAISVDGATGIVRQTVTVGVADDMLHLSRAQTARVIVEIVPAPIERVFRDVRVRVKHVGPGLTTDLGTSRVTVTVHGPRGAFDTVRPETVEAFVDLAGLGAGRYTLPVRITSGRRITIDAIDPSTVDVQIRSSGDNNLDRPVRQP